MNKFLIFAFIFALTNCSYLTIDKCTGPIGNDFDIYIDTTQTQVYKYNFEFDWTDDDNPKFTVPIKVVGGSISEANVSPLFINASTVSTSSNFVNSGNYGSATITTSDCTDGDIATIKIYNKYPVYYPFDASDGSISSTEISAKIKSTTVKANENDVTQKFIKYFGIAYCSGKDQVKVKYFDNILVTVNNGNYFSTSKILLACLALLFL